LANINTPRTTQEKMCSDMGPGKKVSKATKPAAKVVFVAPPVRSKKPTPTFAAPPVRSKPTPTFAITPASKSKAQAGDGTVVTPTKTKLHTHVATPFHQAP